MRIVVVGGGVLGTLVALELKLQRLKPRSHTSAANNAVEIWDAGPTLTPIKPPGASTRAAAMVSPFSELDSVDVRITELGQRSLAVWADYLERFPEWRPHYHRRGCWAVAAPSETTEWARLRDLTSSHFPNEVEERVGATTELSGCDPRFSRHLFFPREAHLDPKALLAAMHSTLKCLGVETHWNQAWPKDAPSERAFIVDCRGLAASNPGLRAVRGEVVLVAAPEVELQTPVRVLHPRYPIYIVPRGEGRYVIGATTIESASAQPITVRSALELLSTAYAFHPGFGEATLEESWSGLRPAFLDNLPRIDVDPRASRLHANGLYRHGWTVAPEMARQIARSFSESNFTTEDPWLWKYA